MNTNFELDERGLKYEIRPGFWQRARTGWHWKRGFTPLAHLSAIEVTKTNVLPRFFIVVGVAIALAGSFSAIARYRVDGVLLGASLTIGVALVLAQIFWTTMETVFYSDGRRLFRCELPEQQRDTLLKTYSDLKARTVTPAAEAGPGKP